MAEHPWWPGAVIYQLYPRSFHDSDGDGTGDVPGIIDRLDYLNDGTPDSLGVSGIWLNPIYPSPLYDFGYDISDYRNIDPVYGTLDDFDRLVAAAHEHGIRIVMDLVANHTSHLHPWFQESRSSRDNPRRDWYIWRDAPPGKARPNNWEAVFGGSAWEWDEQTQQFYCHAFLKEQPDLNWHNPEVRAAVLDVIRFWLERGVDGFRLDAIGHIGKHPDYPDNPYRALSSAEPDADNRELDHIYDRLQPVMHDWVREMRRVADEYGALLVGEIYEPRYELLASFTGPDQFNACFNFELLLSPWDAGAFRASVDGLGAALPAGYPQCPVLGNHDKPRSFSRYDADGLGAARARVAAMMLLTLPGTPFVYYGEEIGMHDVAIPKDRIRDPEGTRLWPNPGRDPERTPMQWDDTEKAGFTTGNPWLPIADDYRTVNVAVERDDPQSLLTLYRRLIWLRREAPALTHGGYRPLDAPFEDIYAYVREAEGDRILTALNFGPQPRTLQLDHLGPTGRILVATDGDQDAAVSLSALPLTSDSGVVVRID